MSFVAAKLVLVHDGALLTYLRDDFAHIPHPAHWDLPGGGREGDEAPAACALRELHEEFGLRLMPDRLEHAHAFPSVLTPGAVAWFFAASLTASDIAAIRFGDEGQFWQMMPVADYIAHPRAVPGFGARVAACLG